MTATAPHALASHADLSCEVATLGYGARMGWQQPVSLAIVAVAAGFLQ